MESGEAGKERKQRRKKRRRSRTTRSIKPSVPARSVWLWLLGVAAVGACAVGWLVLVYPESRASESDRSLVVEVDPAAGVGSLAQQLAAHKLLESPGIWTTYARVMGAEQRLRRGRIMVRENMTAGELLRRVAVGYGYTELRVTLPEGLTVAEMAIRLERWGVCDAQSFVEASQDPILLASLEIEGDSAEGYLFPDTYWLRDGMRARGVIRKLVETSNKRWEGLMADHRDGFRKLRDQLGWEFRQVLIMASIVEKEAAIAEEQPIIAGVFLNRLRDENFQPRRLQADPTVAYGCLRNPALTSCQGFDGRRVTRTMTAGADNPYNTYRHPGLPPGPIASPGLSALRAVLQAQRHDYFYFVASGAGRHRFSRTLEAHNDAVQARRDAQPEVERDL